MSHDEEILGKAYDGRLMRRLLTYLRPYRLEVVISLVAIIAYSGLQLTQPYLFKIAIDHEIATGNLRGLNLIALLFLAVLLLQFAAEYLQTYVMQMTGQRIMYDLRMQIYEHLQRLDLSFYDRNPVGRLMTRVTTDVDVLNDLFTAGVVAVFGDVFTLVGIMVVLLRMNWKLALVTFSVLPLLFLVTELFRIKVRESYRSVRIWIARINAFLQENLTGMATVQVFRREPKQFSRFEEINAKHRDANLDAVLYYAVFYPAVEFIGALAVALIIWNGGARVIAGALTLGSLVAFIQYSQRFFRPISDMSEKFNMLQAAMASSERIFRLLDTPVTLTIAPAPRQVSPEARGRIEFDHVWFAYRDEEFVLRDVSFSVAPGERVGVVGATGAGKTTIINLLMRFYDVTRGRILIDGGDIREYDPHSLRRIFSLVLQDVHLFSGTIADNVRLGETAIDERRVRAAAESVHASRFVEQLPERYDTEVVERGATLSVGQKQLLAFARALAFDPKILVLDEATSSIDVETEALIRDALRALMAGRTTIAIAHRLSTIQDMDKILVIHKGRLREVGTHQQLLALRGIYFKLYQLQYKDQEVGVASEPVPNGR